MNSVNFFEEVDATILSATENTLEVVVPEGAQTGALTVTVNGEIARSKQDFVIAPTI